MFGNLSRGGLARKMMKRLVMGCAFSNQVDGGHGLAAQGALRFIAARAEQPGGMVRIVRENGPSATGEAGGFGLHRGRSGTRGSGQASRPARLLQARERQPRSSRPAARTGP